MFLLFAFASLHANSQSCNVTQTSLCFYNDSQFNFYPSWCQWDNPFAPVLPLWEADTLVDQTECLDPSGCLTPLLEGCDITTLDECDPITSVTTLELDFPTINSTQSQNATGWVFSIFGMSTGVIFATYTQVNVVRASQQLAFSFQAHGQPVTMLEAWVTNSTGFLLSSDSSTVMLWKFSVNDADRFTLRRDLCFSETGAGSISSLNMWSSSKYPSMVYAGWLVGTPAIEIRRFNGMSCGIDAQFTRSLAVTANQPIPVSWLVTEQQFTASSQTVFRDLFIVSGPTAAHVYQFDDDNQTAPLPATQTWGYGNPDDSTCVYHTTRNSFIDQDGASASTIDHTLSAAHIFGEEFRLTPDGQVAPDYQLLWLVLGIVPATVYAVPSPDVFNFTDLRDVESNPPPASYYLVVLGLEDVAQCPTCTRTVLSNTVWCDTVNPSNCAERIRKTESFISPVAKVISRPASQGVVGQATGSTGLTPLVSLLGPSFDLATPEDVVCELSNQGIPPRLLSTNIFVVLNSTTVAGDGTPSSYGSIRVFAFQSKFNDSYDILFEKATNFEFPGRLTSVHLTPNIQHIMVVVARSEFEVYSTNRLNDICDVLAVNYSNPFLQSYSPLCGSRPARTASALTDFVFTISACPPSTFCPRFWTSALQSTVAPGYYTFRKFELLPCEPGYFCTSGVRSQCPTGFICPFPKMTAPIKCRLPVGHTYTCWHSNPSYEAGLTAPVPCTRGAFCNVPYLPGMPAPPGTALDPNNHFVSCVHKEWCSLGRSYSKAIFRMLLLCPPQSYCSEPDVLQPTECVPDTVDNAPVVQYCPAGTTSKNPCDAGFYCSIYPDIPEETPCRENFYCPAGSWDEKFCPAGYYCPTPSEKLVCEKGYFCQRGLPPQRCPFLTSCPAGTKSLSKTAAGPVVTIFLVSIPVILWHLFLKERNKRRTKRHKAREESWKQEAEQEREEKAKEFEAQLAKRKTVYEGKKRARTMPAGPARLLNVPMGGSVALHSPLSAASVAPEESPRNDEQVGLDSDGVELDVRKVTLLESDSSAEPVADQSLDEARPPKISRMVTRNEDPKIAPVGDQMPGRRKVFPLNITFDNLSFSLGDKVLLKDVSGSFLSGEMTAIMGPSGCGKSTLLNVLLGKQPGSGTRSGQVFVNGHETHLQQYRKFVGFVPQSDVMHTELTVKENIEHSALMRLPNHIPFNEKRQVITRVIKDLGLYVKRHDVIGDDEKRGLSGGQKKKVNVGIELAAEPSVLFLDEPTSGLDSSTSQSLMTNLKMLAVMQGVTVVAVIHQPRFEIFQQFDKIVLLGTQRFEDYTQGRLVYFGPTDRIIEYFNAIGETIPEHSNPADFFLDVQEKRAVLEFAEMWMKKSSEFAPPQDREVTSLPPERITLHPVFQTFFFMRRAFAQQSRFWWAFFFDVALTMLAGLFLGLINYNTEYIGAGTGSTQAIEKCENVFGQGALVCIMPVQDKLVSMASTACMSLGLLATAGSVRIFGRERVVFWRESSTGTNTLAYYIGKSVAHLPNSLVAAGFFLIFYIQLAQPRADTVTLYSLCLLVYWTATGYGYIVSILFPNNSLLWGVLCCLINFMFSGANPTFSQLRSLLGQFGMFPTYLSYFRWIQEAWYIAEIQDYRKLYEVGPGMAYFGYDISHYHRCIGACVGIGFFLRVLAYVLLEVLYREKRR